MKKIKFKKIILSIVTIGICIIVFFKITNKPSRNTGEPQISWERYENKQHSFSLNYPTSWKTKINYRSVIITPLDEQLWEPNTPQDISKDPFIKIDFGSHVKERIGPKWFPEIISSKTIEEWLNKKIDNGEDINLVKREINGITAFEITETYTSGCYKVVYWRPENLEQLVRIQTGCESKYINIFDEIILTLNEL